MRISNNNQTTFGMNPKLILDQATPKLVKRVNRVKAKIIDIGNSKTVCELGNTSNGKVFVRVNLEAPDSHRFSGGILNVSPKASIVGLVREANAILTQHITNKFSDGVIK